MQIGGVRETQPWREKHINKAEAERVWTCACHFLGQTAYFLKVVCVPLAGRGEAQGEVCQRTGAGKEWEGKLESKGENRTTTWEIEE